MRRSEASLSFKVWASLWLLFLTEMLKQCFEDNDLYADIVKEEIDIWVYKSPFSGTIPSIDCTVHPRLYVVAFKALCGSPWPEGQM